MKKPLIKTAVIVFLMTTSISALAEGSLVQQPKMIQPLDKQVLQELDSSNQLYLDDVSNKKAYYSKLKSTSSEYGYQHGYASEMKYIKDKMMSEKNFWNGLLDFSPWSGLLSSGAAKGMYLIGGIVDEVDSSVRRVDKKLIVREDKKYIIREYPYLAISPPHWADYLFSDKPKNLQLPPSSILPQNEQEREIWVKGSNEGWNNGVKVARSEFRKRYTLLFADLIGMVRYWRLVEGGTITEVQVKAVNHRLSRTVNDTGEELILNPTSIEITEQSTFSIKPSEWSAISSHRQNESSSNAVRNAIIEGAVSLEELTNRDITIYTPEHEALMETVKSERFNEL
ncbi:type IV secretory system conjugative DNA transfer family protein [Vibrio sp. TRT 29B02]|uniref:type IV secretory system conjugative DNA transfer family protein n=1 Tax=Vibrio sp. TRT 29B02 TaxID=3418508 RepID=UPI003CF7263E